MQTMGRVGRDNNICIISRRVGFSYESITLLNSGLWDFPTSKLGLLTSGLWGFPTSKLGQLYW